jgi:hypothetical protein
VFRKPGGALPPIELLEMPANRASGKDALSAADFPIGRHHPKWLQEFASN